MLSALRDAETGERGYALTGEPAFLEPYHAVRDGIGGRLDELRRNTRATAAHPSLDALEPLVAAHLEQLSHVVELRRKPDMAAVLAAVGNGAGKRLMDSIREEMGRFLEIETRELERHDARLQSRMRLLLALISAASLLALLAAISFAYWIHRETRHQVMVRAHLETQHLLEVREAAHGKLRESNDRLQTSEERLAVKENAAQQALRDSATALQAILNTVADGVITLHAGGAVIETVNLAAERMFGYSAAELIGKDPDLLISSVDRDPRNGFLALHDADGAAHPAGLGREVVGRRKDGSTFPLEIAVSDMWLGGQRHFTGSLRDVSARKQAEEALLKGGVLQAAIFNSANFSSIATDANGVIQIFVTAQDEPWKPRISRIARMPCSSAHPCCQCNQWLLLRLPE